MRRSSRRSGLFGASARARCVLLAALPGCSGLLGVDAYRTARQTEPDGAATATPTVGTCAGYAYASDSCRTCFDGECCPELSACADDPGCRGLTGCQLACGGSDVACRSECVERYASSTLTSDSWTAVSSCKLARCARECGETCGAPRFGSGCAACMERTCCSEWGAISDTAEVATYAACRLRARQEDCVAPSTEAVTAWDSYAACRARCDGSCNHGEAPADWSCLGSVVEPRPAKGLDNVEVHATATLAGGRPLEGISVLPCPTANFGCLPWTPPGRTGPDGKATVLAPATGAFYLLFRDEATPPAVDEMAWYLYPQPVHGPLYWRVPLYTPGTMEALFQAIGPQFDLTKSHVHVVVSSCGGASADGVVLSSPDSPDALLFYGSADLLPAAGQEQTSLASNGGFVNVTPGRRITVEARIKATNQLIVRVPLPVMDHGMTLAFIGPSPDSEKL